MRQVYLFRVVLVRIETPLRSVTVCSSSHSIGHHDYSIRRVRDKDKDIHHCCERQNESKERGASFKQLSVKNSPFISDVLFKCALRGKIDIYVSMTIDYLCVSSQW